MEIKDNTFQRQFEASDNGKLVTIEYSNQERKIFLTRIVKPEGYENEDFINGMLTQILDGAIEKNMKVVPTFPKIAAFFRKHTKYKELLPPGIKI